MTVTLSTEKVGRRVYVIGNTFPIKSRLKEAGCKFDPDRKQWWIGSTKADKIERIVGKLDGQEVEQDKSELSDRRCDGKVEYKGRTYYVIGRSDRKGKLWLTVLDCSIDFWAAESECRWVKRYQPQQRWGGYGRGQVEVYQTVGRIRDFVEQEKRARSRNEPVCGECGKSGELVDDLEDGVPKHPRCCDIPPAGY